MLKQVLFSVTFVLIAGLSFAQQTTITPSNVTTGSRDYVLSIPASSFQASDNTTAFHNNGAECYFDNGTSNTYYFHAPIALRDSIRVKELELVVRCRAGGTLKIELIEAYSNSGTSTGGSFIYQTTTLWSSTGFNFPGDGFNGFMNFHLPFAVQNLAIIQGTFPIKLNPLPYGFSGGDYKVNNSNFYYLKVSQVQNWYGDFKILGAVLRYQQ